MRGRIGPIFIGLVLILGGFVGLLNLSSDDVEAPPTFVSGTVYDGSGGPWTPAGNPYIVVGNIAVPTGQVLTIQPGVQVKFDGYYGIFVTGNLLAIGTEGNRINITSNKATPSIGDWDRIRVKATSGRLEFRFSDISYGSVAINLNDSTSYNVIMNCNIMSNNVGVFANSSGGNNLSENHIFNNEYGVVFTHSNYNNITDNNISSNFHDGLYIEFQTRNVIKNNSILSNGGNGIHVVGTTNSHVVGNLVSFNGQYGIRLYFSSTGNRIYHNNIIENGIQADDNKNGAVWNDTYPSGGNHWSDFDEESEGCIDNFDGPTTPQFGGGPDGICDSQYNIDADSIDYYPLAKPLTPELPLITDLEVVGPEVNISWNLSPSIDVNAYDIYGGATQTSIDFSNPLFSTPDEIPPAQQFWAQFPFDTIGNPEYYFVVRARNNTLVERSTTSNTAGYYQMDFGIGLSTFSLPLKPFSIPNLDALMIDMVADTISWLDANDDWQTHPSNPVTPAAEVGKGYVVEFSSQKSYYFAGESASMILYRDGFGFDEMTRDDINASVGGNGDVTVSWTPIAGADSYRVLKSDVRDGFHTGSFVPFDVLTPPFLDIGAASVPGKLYYMVVPYNTTLGDGASTYSIGVITMEYNGNEMIGLPLKSLWGDMSADWHVDRIPNALGIVHLKNGVWIAHFKEFPEGVYDTIIEYGKGYELTTIATSRYSFIGF